MNNETVFLSKEFDRKMEECRLLELKNPSNAAVLESVLKATRVSEVDASCKQLMELLRNFNSAVTSMLRGKYSFELTKEKMENCTGKRKRRLL